MEAPRSSAVGAKIKAPRVGCEERVSPPHQERGLGRGRVPSPEIFRFLNPKTRVLVHSGTDKTYFVSAWRLDFLVSSCLGGGASADPVDPSLPAKLSVAHVLNGNIALPEDRHLTF